MEENEHKPRDVYLVCFNCILFDEKTQVFYKNPFFLVKGCQIFQLNRDLGATAPYLHIQPIASISMYFQQAHMQAHVNDTYVNIYKAACEEHFTQKHSALRETQATLTSSSCSSLWLIRMSVH